MMTRTATSSVQATPTTGRDILVVEPNAGVSSAICAALRRRGHRVSAALTLEEALELPAPDLLVSEIAIHHGSGFELVESLRARRPDLAVLLLTALPRFEDCRRALRAGVHDVVAKPFRLDALMTLVEEARGPRSATPRAVIEEPTPATLDESAEVPKTFEARYPVTDASVRRAARDVAAFALHGGATPATRARLATGTAEILDNAVRHSASPANSSVTVQVTRDGRDLLVRIEDEGSGFDAVSGWIDSAPSLVESPGRLPSGLARATSLADDLRVESNGSGTRVRMRFTDIASGFAEDEADFSDLDFLLPAETRHLLTAVLDEEPGGFANLPPALAVAVGRLLSGPRASQAAQAALWS